MASNQTQSEDGGPESGGRRRGSNQSDVRAHNERLLLSLVRRRGTLAKAEIARLSGLSPQTVSVIIRKLEKEGLLLRGAPVRGQVGQPYVPMALARDGVFAFGMKIGRRSVELVLMDFVGQARATRRRTYAWPLPADIVEFARTEIADILAGLTPAQRGRIAGLGIASPFELWSWAEEVGAPPGEMDAWRGTDLLAELEGGLPFPVFLQNDASAACGAELVFGRGRAFKDFLYLFIGFFIGGGMALNGSVFVGSSGNAAAIGSMPVPGPVLGRRMDGKPVQLIDAASIFVLEARLKAAGVDPSPLWLQPENWSGFGAHLDSWIAETARQLAHAIVASCSLIDFPAVVVDGGFPPEVRIRLVGAIQREVMQLDLKGIAAPVIVEGEVGPNARAIGGACLPLFDRYMLDQRSMAPSMIG